MAYLYNETHYAAIKRGRKKTTDMVHHTGESQKCCISTESRHRKNTYIMIPYIKFKAKLNHGVEIRIVVISGRELAAW